MSHWKGLYLTPVGLTDRDLDFEALHSCSLCSDNYDMPERIQ